MIGDVGSVLLDGPILALLLAVYSIVLGGICYWRGRAKQAHVEARQRVRDTVKAETAARLGELVPGQREPS